MKTVMAKLDAKKVKRLVLPNLPYVFLWWFFAKVGEAYRLTPGRDTLKRLFGTAGQLNTVFAHPLPSPILFDITIGLIGAAAVYGVVTYRKYHSKKWRKEVLCYKGRQWRIAEKPCSHGVCGTNGRTGKLAIVRLEAEKGELYGT